jgi:hypothetical protein
MHFSFSRQYNCIYAQTDIERSALQFHHKKTNRLSLFLNICYSLIHFLLKDDKYLEMDGVYAQTQDSISQD